MIKTGADLVSEILDNKFLETMEGKWVVCPVCSWDWTKLHPKYNFCVKCTETVRGLDLIAKMYPVKSSDLPFDNWGQPDVKIQTIPGMLGFVRCKTMNMETGEKYWENETIWSNLEAVITWGGNRATIQKSGQLFKINFYDGDPIYADGSLHAWAIYRKLAANKSSEKSEEEKSLEVKKTIRKSMRRI